MITTQDRLLKKITIDDNDCWIFNGSLNENGYGKIMFNGKTWLVHRLFYKEWLGDIPTNQGVLHTCDIRSCCNPNHLFAGTQKDNVIDMLGKKRRCEIIRNRPPRPTSLDGIELLTYILDNWTKKNGKCLEYKFDFSSHYPNIAYKSKTIGLHILVWLLHTDSKIIPNKHFVMHQCHNKACINPEHLIIGTNKQNQIDSRSYSLNTKLNLESVQLILQEALLIDFSVRGVKTKFDKYFSKKFNVHPDTISRIRRKELWGDVTI